MTALFTTVLLASLFGSAHCAGMCGGFVVFYAGGGDKLGSHIAYNAGRLLTYVALGAVAGALGHAVDLAGSAAGLQRSAMILAGLSMFFGGTLALLRALNVSVPALPVPAGAQKTYRAALTFLRGKPPILRALILGLSSTLLPCGWLYSFALVAAGTGSALWGALAMAVFWLGTLPMLVGMATVVQKLSGPLRCHLPLVSAVALMVVGFLAIAQHAKIAPMHGQSAQTLQQAAIQARALQTGEQKPACCHDDE